MSSGKDMNEQAAPGMRTVAVERLPDGTLVIRRRPMASGSVASSSASLTSQGRAQNARNHVWSVCSPTSLAHAVNMARQDRRALCGMVRYSSADWEANEDRDRCYGCSQRMEFRWTQAPPRR
jgi:hypothetical protein